MKNKHRIKQGLSLLLAGGIALTNLGAALPAFAEDAAATPETASAATPETAEANVPTPNLSQITENLYNDLPDAPTGSYLGSMGLPVATGETKIGISAWVSDLYDGVDAHMDADALNADENTVTIGKTPGTDYAIVPLLAQVEYPADGAASEIILPDGVELLSYLSTDYEPIPADEQEQTEILHQTYSEQSAAATGLYVKASADFTAQLVYTDSDGSSQSKAIHVQISEDAAPTQMYADTGDDSIAAYAAGPTPPYTTGKITSIAKEGGTWLIWFNGQEAYCCSHGLNGQPKGCPTYSFSHVSRLEPGQYTPGNHYANQVNIWGGLGQLSLDMLDDRPVVASLEDDPEVCEEQPDILGSLYDETQQWIMENYPDSYAAQTYIAAAEELVNGTDAQSGENGYYTYIYNPPAGYAWQVVALVGEEIAGGTEIPDVPSVPEPKYYSAAWTAPAQTAGGSFDLTFTVNTDKYQQNTLEKVDGAVITVTPSRTGGSVDGGSWQMTPAAAQTITTSGHTQDDSFHLNGGDGSATWTVHYEVSKTSTSTLSGQEGPFTSQAEADAAAEAAKNAAIGQLQNEAQGIRKRMESGTYRTSSVPYGYKQVNYDLVPAPNQIEIVKDIFNAFLQGESTTKIADDLNRLRPDADKHWHHTTIERILKNEKYAGCSLYQKSYTSDDLPFKRTENNGEVLSYYAPDTHNGIISQADFDKVQALLQRKSVGPCPRKDTAFSKMLYCAECGSMLSRKINRSTQATWLCRTYLRCAADCPTPPIQEELIQRAFLTMHNKLIVNYTQIFAPALHDLYAAQKILDDKESQRQELNQQVHLLAKKLHNLSRLREKNCITAAQYWERRNPLERELTDVKNTISKAATNHPLLRTLAQTKQLAEHYTYLKPLTEFDEYEFKFAVNRVLVDSESCTFELKNGMKFKEIF